jgi:hypothetical protein
MTPLVPRDHIPVFMEAGHMTAVRLTGVIEDPVQDFLRVHPQEQRCTIAYNGDEPIGRQGILIDAGRIVASPKKDED